jgi:hypothetical protein
MIDLYKVLLRSELLEYDDYWRGIEKQQAA